MSTSIRPVKILPKDAYIRDSLGWYYYKKGDLKKALKELKKAWNDEKKDVVITKHLAIVYQELNKTELAARFFEEALRNCSKESERMDILKSMEGNIMKISRLAHTYALIFIPLFLCYYQI